MSRVARLAWTTLAFNVFVILWGAFVRATGSGAGCGEHWPLCNGAIVPRAPAVDTLIELTHRVTSGIALVLVAALALMAFRAPGASPLLRRSAAVSLGLILLEAALGAGLVLFRLVAENDSLARALVMAVHLVNTFVLLAALTLAAYAASGGRTPSIRGSGVLGVVVGMALIGLALSGASGAVAALGDTLFPAGTLGQAFGQDLSPASHILLRLRVLHPTAAIATGMLLVVLARHAARTRPGRQVTRLAAAVTGAVLLQVAGGFLNVVLLAPVWMQLVHLLLADLLWILVVLLAATALARPSPALAERRLSTVPAR